LGFGTNDPRLLPTVERLNKVRNQVAHTFDLDRVALDQMLQLHYEDYRDFKPKDYRERVRMLRWLCVAVCAMTSGTITAAYFSARDDAARFTKHERQN
jgi:hypothetical protein